MRCDRTRGGGRALREGCVNDWSGEEGEVRM